MGNPKPLACQSLLLCLRLQLHLLCLLLHLSLLHHLSLLPHSSRTPSLLRSWLPTMVPAQSEPVRVRLVVDFQPVVLQLEEPREELYSWLYEYAEQGGWFHQVGGLHQNQSTPGAETGDRELVPPPENEGTLAARLDVAADVAGAGLTNDGLGGGGETVGGFGTDTRKRPPDEQLDHKTAGGGSASRIQTGAPAVVGGTMSQSGLLTRAGGGLHPLAQCVQLTHCELKHLRSQMSRDQRCRHG
jgi:hypothetical protein